MVGNQGTLYLGNFSASIKLVQNLNKNLKKHVIKVQIPKLSEEKARLKIGHELAEPMDTTLQEGIESWWTAKAKKRKEGKKQPVKKFT